MNRTEKRQALKELKKRRAGQKMKKYDITEKLKFNENPYIVVKGKEVEINARAKEIIEVASLFDKGDTFEAITVAYEKLFDAMGKKVIDDLNLDLDDYNEFMNTAVVLAMGGDPDEQGE